MNKYNEISASNQLIVTNNHLIHNDSCCGVTGIQGDTHQITSNITISESTTTNTKTVDYDDIDISGMDLSNVPRIERDKKSYAGNGILSHFSGVHYRSENQWIARCPAHNDGTPSLSIKYDTQTKHWICHCHAGCTFEQIKLAADLSNEDLGFRADKKGSIVEAVYKYTDENGAYLFESKKLRKKDGSKTFVQTCNGSKDVKGIRRVLYGLPDVIKAGKGNKILVICEGEKDAETIKSFSSGKIVATTNSGGASKWLEEYTKSIVAYGIEHVFIIQDNDDAGKRHAIAVANSIALRDLNCKIITMPGVKDVSDWVAAKIEDIIARYPGQGIPKDFAELVILKEFAELLDNGEPFEIDENDIKYGRLLADSAMNQNWKGDSKIISYIENSFYNQKSKLFYLPNNSSWVEVTRVDARFSLGALGIPVRLNPLREDQNISDVDVALSNIIRENSVIYSGQIAGYHSGIRSNCGKKILITSSPEFPVPIKGDHSTIDGILNNMLGMEQKLILECSLKLHIEQLYKSLPHQQQVLCFVGKAGSGKSVLQNLIITPLLGKRCARAYKFFSGQDQYNSQIIESEHLMIEDDSPAFDTRSRNALTVNLTGVAVNEVTSVRGMYCAAVNLTAIQLVTLSANIENINTMPYINDSSSDKIMLFKCERFDMPMPTGTPGERKAFADRIESEISAYAYYLLNELVVPKDLYDKRYGVTTYHNPEVLSLMREQSIEGEFQLMLEDTLFGGELENLTWTGTASELLNVLSMDSRIQRRAERLLPNTRTVGRLLVSLSKQYPDNYKHSHTRKGEVWVIKSIGTIKIDSDIEKAHTDIESMNIF